MRQPKRWRSPYIRTESCDVGVGVSLDGGDGSVGWTGCIQVVGWGEVGGELTVVIYRFYGLY